MIHSGGSQHLHGGVRALAALTALVLALFAFAGESHAADTWSGDALPAGTKEIRGVSCPATDFCVAVGIGPILHWDGTSWSAPGPAGPWQAVSCSARDFCVATKSSGEFYHWDGTAWTSRTNPLGYAQLGVSCTAANFCKAVGVLGTILSWNGTSWSVDEGASGTNSWRAVSCTYSSFCEAVGEPGIKYWNGATWTAETNPTGGPLYGVSCVTTVFCKALGEGGAIIGWNGTPWSAETSPTTERLLAVSCISTTFCKAVGAGGTILGWDGTSWTADSSGVDSLAILQGVSCFPGLCKAGGATTTVPGAPAIVRTLSFEVPTPQGPTLAFNMVQYTSSGALPYTPGTWSRWQVTAYISCVPGDSPIKTNTFPASRSFSNDGIYNLGKLLDGYYCKDAAGNMVAASDSGPKIKIDRHAPTCSITPQSQTVPKNNPPNSGQKYTRSVTVSSQDGALTGLESVSFETVMTNGIGSWTQTGPFTFRFEGKPGAIYTITYRVTDQAGWTSTCSAKVKTSLN
jgi:hypothetical protein